MISGRSPLIALLVLTILFSAEAVGQNTPRITISALQVVNAEHIEVRGTAFTPRQNILSHLRWPEGTESLRTFIANDRGEFFHNIDTLLLSPGTYELWVVDDRSKAVSNTVRFSVGFDAATPPFSEALDVIAQYRGVWRGNGARNSPPAPATVLMSITGRDGGSIGGTIMYPSLSCGALLSFRAVYPDAIEFNETSKFGTERCAGEGIVKLKLEYDGTLNFEWRHPKLPGIGTGKLAPQR
jgi:hypothetical protein